MLFYYITILLIPFSNHPLLSYNVGGITPIKVFGGLSLLVAIIELGKPQIRKNKFSSKVSIYFIMFIVVYLMSVLANSAHYNSDVALRFVSIIIFFITTITLVNNKDRFMKAMLLTLFCMDIAAAYMFREYSLYGGMYANFRPGGILGDPNYTALNLLTVIPIALLYARTCTSKFEKIFVYSSFLICLAALGLSQSRGGYAALIIELFLISLALKFRVKTLVGAVLALVFVATMLPVDIFSRFSTEDTGVKISTEARMKLIESGASMFRDNLVFGVGPGNFKSYSDIYSEEIGKKQIAHNSYLELAAELGGMGIILFVVIAITSIKSLNQLRLQYVGDLKLYAIFNGIKIGLIGYLVAATFLSAEYEKIYWFMVFLVVAATRIMFVVNENKEDIPLEPALSR